QGVQQIKKYGAQVLVDEVVDVKEKDGSFVVALKDGATHTAKTIVIATGVSYTPTGIPGEKERVGRGVAMCVACDGPLFTNKPVAVVGNGNHAASEAIELLAHTKQVTLFSNGREWKIDPTLLKRLEQAKIPLRKDRIKGFIGEKFVKGLELADGSTVEVSGVFSAMGVAGAVALAMKVGAVLDNNFIVIDRDSKTNVENVYAAGACTGGNYQIAKSVGEGCNAGVNIIKKLKGLDTYSDLT
ncbi:MAG: NAD(P)/FAD-dependent oxidoreductase, partial [Nanoarchaeota archaeon]